MNSSGGVIVSAIDRGLETLSGQTKDYKIGICCFSAKHAAVRKKSKDWFSQTPIMCLSADCSLSELVLV
jgi:hypothetical protein